MTELNLELFSKMISPDIQRYIVKEFMEYNLYTDWGKKGIFNKRKEFHDLCVRDTNKWLHILLSDNTVLHTIELGNRSFLTHVCHVKTNVTHRVFHTLCYFPCDQEFTSKEVIDHLALHGGTLAIQTERYAWDGEVNLQQPIICTFYHKNILLKTNIMNKAHEINYTEECIRFSLTVN